MMKWEEMLKVKKGRPTWYQLKHGALKMQKINKEIITKSKDTI